MKRGSLFVFIFISFIAGFSRAEQRQYYGSENLSCSLIKKMLQDTQGFIWIATENGLNKFDGWTFTNYFHNKKDSTSLISNVVESLVNDSKGRLWVGSGNGLQRYSPYKNAFETVHFPNGSKPSVLALQELNTGEIWAVTAGYGAYSVNPETLKATPLTSVNEFCGSFYMHNIYQDHLHRIWIALSDRVVCINPDLQEVEFYTISGRVYTMLEDSAKRLWLATSGEVYSWNETKRCFVKVKQHEKKFLGIRGLICTKKGNLYVNTMQSGIWSIDTKKNELIPFGNEINNVCALMEDKNENLWLGCYKAGIMMLSNEVPQFEFQAVTSSSFSGNVLSFIYQDRTGDLWTSMSDGILIHMDKKMKKLSSYDIGGGVISMLEDSKGTFWLGTNYGSLMQFDKQTGTVQRFAQFQGKPISQIIEGHDSTLYISTMGDGFMSYSLQNEIWEHINGESQLNASIWLDNNWINTMLCDSEGMIWLGHCNGLNCYDPQKHQFLDLGCENLLKFNLCYALLEDQQGHIWIGTNNGLFEYNKKTQKLRYYGIEEGMPSNVVCGLGKGKNGDIWCSTYNGLCKLVHPGKEIVNYFSGGGLKDKEYLKGVYSQRENGPIYVGGIRGITRFVPDSIGKALTLREPQLVHVYLNNEEVSGNLQFNGVPVTDDVWMNAKQINMTYKHDIFAFEFSTMEFHERENVRFEYRLIELGGKWRRTAPGENRITYSYLPSGRYTLEVRTCENEQRSPVRSFSIYIAPPWYNTVWAKISYAIVLLGIIFGIFYAWYTRLRRQRKEELNEEKLKFFINITHELRSPITLIISPLTNLIKTEQDATKRKTLQTMQRNANRIINLINQLLDIRKIDKGQMKMSCRETDLVEFIEELSQMFDYQACKRNIHFSFIHSVESLPVWIDRNNFDKVLINLIVNAFKYTPDNGEIRIELAVGKDSAARGALTNYAEIIIIDSGTGLDENKLEKIFERFYQDSTNSHGFGIGLNLTKMLVELHHGVIFATNRTDKQGSCFTVRIPMGKEHLKPEELVEEKALHNEQPVRLALQEEPYWNEEEEKLQQSKSKTQWRVLVVDDDEEMREYLKQELRIYYKVVTACNGVEAYQMILKQRIDLIISDVIMPKMDGFELLKNVKTNSNISHIPFILLTSQAEYESRLKGWNVGTDAYLAKPFQVEELLLICENLITGRIRLKGRFGMDQEIEEKMKPIEVKANDEFFMERLMKAINENFDNPKFSVEDLAGAVGVSRVQLHRKLKVLTGNTTSEFLRNIRLKQAAKLLKEKKVNVSQVAYLVGFTNPVLFSIAFKKFYGCSPSEYADREIEE